MSQDPLNERDFNEKVKMLFCDFLQKHTYSIDEVDLSILDDEFVCDYLVNTIIDFANEFNLNTGDWQDDYHDFETFSDTIDAYFAGFKNLATQTLVEFLKQVKTAHDSMKNTNSKGLDSLMEIIGKHKHETVQSNSDEAAGIDEEKLGKISNDGKESNDDADSVVIDCEEIGLLREMFPKCQLKEIKKVYEKVDRNFDMAIDRLLVVENIQKCMDEMSLEETEKEREELKKRIVQKCVTFKRYLHSLFNHI